MNQTLFCLEIIILCVVCGVADYISDTTDTSDSTDPSFAYCGGNNWVPYKDEKCFKIIEKLATRDEAEIICNQDFRTDSVAPTLVSIKSAAEQEYLTNFVFKTSGIDNNVWIGAKRQLENNNQFVWNDGSDIEFNNWAEGSPTEEYRRSCVQMQSEFSKQFSNMSGLDQRAINGRWKDVTCSLGNWVLCQKLQTWSLQHLQKTFLDSRKELHDSLKDVTNQLSNTINQLDNTKNELTTIKNELATTKNDLTSTKNELATTKNDLTSTKNELATTKNDLTTTKNELATTKNDLTSTKNEMTTIKSDLINTNNKLTTSKNELEVLQKNPIPIGFIYVQLPGQREPWSLWGSVNWIEITSEYAGLFFRVLGGGSEHFGVTQEGNAPRLVGAKYIRDIGKALYNVNILSNNEWSSPIESGGTVGNEGRYAHLSFKVSNGEVRPRNKAIRIWKRTN